MAPNKKKNKKASANPARGFATTSIVSKSKIESDVTESVQQPADNKLPVVEESSCSTSFATSKATQEEVDLSKLTPEQLEAQFEEEDLQLFVEKHGAKVKKESTRTISRLLTERRLARNQAEALSLGKWLSEDVMRSLADRVRDTYTSVASSSRAVAMLNVDELVARLWALKQTLEGLGFSQERSVEALVHVAGSPSLIDQATNEESRDGLWGLSVALDWLGLSCNESELLNYNSHPDMKKPKVMLGFDAGLSYLSETTNATSSTSGATTPDTAASETARKADNTQDQIPRHDRSDNDEDVVSGLDEDVNDLEPRQMQDMYLRFMSKLHARRPDLTEAPVHPKRKGKARQNTETVPPDRISARLLQKIRKIERDMLFDKEAAQDAWSDVRIRLLKDAAERRKLQLDREEPKSEAASQNAEPLEQAEEKAQAEKREDTMDLGDFFGSLPEEQVNGESGIRTTAVTSEDGTSITVRDFGKWVGVNPRRTLEESCRARDSSSKVTFNILSTTSFSNRHSVRITWSKPQDLPDETALPGLVVRADEKNFQVEMTTVSTPDKMQSESFISTVALFLVFAPSPKEEKAHLRLPAIWRDLWSEFSAAREDRLNALSREEVRSIRKLVEDHQVQQAAIETTETTSKTQPNGNHPLPSSETAPFPPFPLEPSPESLSALWASKSSSPSYIRMLSARHSLPVWSFKDALLQTIEENPVTIVCGETGCGKSTQVPSFILSSELSAGRSCKIYITEPRRISAISLARRVSEELGERKLDVGTERSLVGYAIRLENKVASSTRLVFATTGIVMRMLESPEGFEGVSHVILDEVHERSIDSDFLLIVLKRLLVKRPGLKVVLMSATVNAERFSRYLGGAPVLDVPGRTFPVETRFLEDALETVASTTGLQSLSQMGADDLEVEEEGADDGQGSATTGDLSHLSAQTRKLLAGFNEYRINYGLIVKLLEVVATAREYEEYSKAILVFLPGLAEIRRVNDMLVGHPVFSRYWQVFPLHSTIATDAQEAAFHIPPPGFRKIVLATNIAETGITIPDITCVIDSGKHREMRFDERRQLSRLLETFISRANAKQRRGRAGRVQNGLCFHLFTRSRHDTVLAEQQTPEMLRLSLQDLSLRVKICKLGGIEEVLMEALDPPTPKNIRRAVDSLVEVKALTIEEDLTPLGRQLAKLPLDVYLGKLILFSSIFKCTDAGLTIAAILSSKSPFSAPMGARAQADQARLAFRKGDSDLLTVYNAYCAWRRVCKGSGASEYQFCRKNFLVPGTLGNIEDLKGQLASVMGEAGFLGGGGEERVGHSRAPFSSNHRNFVEVPASSNVNGDNEQVLNSVIAWSFYPKLLSRDGKGWRNVSNNQSVSLHPGSVNKGASDPPRWLSFYHIMQSNSKFYNALETSPVDDMAIALVCGEAEFKTYAGVLVIDGNRIRFSLPNWQSMLVLKALRLRIREIIAQSLKSPTKELSEEQLTWFGVWRQMFSK